MSVGRLTNKTEQGHSVDQDGNDLLGNHANEVIAAWLREYGDRSVYYIKSANFYFEDNEPVVMLTYVERRELEEIDGHAPEVVFEDHDLYIEGKEFESLWRALISL